MKSSRAASRMRARVSSAAASRAGDRYCLLTGSSTRITLSVIDRSATAVKRGDPMGSTPQLGDAVRRAFSPSTGPRTIGVELEMHTRPRVADRAGPRGIPALGAEPEARGHPTLEPGGQLELSLPPQPSIAALLREVDWCLESLAATTEVAL